VTTIALGQLSDYTSGIPVQVAHEQRVLVVVRIEDSLYVLDDKCSHEDFPLSEGDVDVATCAIECVRHGAMFSLATGEPNSFPATRPVPTYEVIDRDGQLEVVVP
jgi:3-phenylpropionate/trans-cinnamate dioxygenase ferredoxin subunit